MIVNGVIINKTEAVSKRIIKVKPIVDRYGSPCGGYVKYNCPVCDLFGEKHQIMAHQDTCDICNVNLDWSNTRFKNSDETQECREAIVFSDKNALRQHDMDVLQEYDAYLQEETSGYEPRAFDFLAKRNRAFDFLAKRN